MPKTCLAKKPSTRKQASLSFHQLNKETSSSIIQASSMDNLNLQIVGKMSTDGYVELNRSFSIALSSIGQTHSLSGLRNNLAFIIKGTNTSKS